MFKRHGRRGLTKLAITILVSVCGVTRGADDEVYPSFHNLPVFIRSTDYPEDPRQHYDVLYYRMDLRVDEQRQFVSGTVLIRARALVDQLAELEVDLRNVRRGKGMTATKVSWVDQYDRDDDRLKTRDVLSFTHERNRIRIRLPRPLRASAVFMVAIEYEGQPRTMSFYLTPRDDAPWIGTSSQVTGGAHSWWPCKSAWANPRDKPDAMDMNITIRQDLVAAAPGQLWHIQENGDGTKTYRWRMNYPIMTYAVTVEVAPFQLIKQTVQIEGLQRKLPLYYYVLPDHVERARKEFDMVPEMIQFFSRVFGPYPFPDAKFALVETTNVGMEHSTIIGYGNNYPSTTGRALTGDRSPGKNFYDYIIIHESAHEWWGNCVSATDWGHFWIHEGFATYAEALWLEHKYGFDAYLAKMRRLSTISERGVSVYRPEHQTTASSYHGNIYHKGACVLHMLRGVMNSDRFFDAIKSFIQDNRFRYGHANTEDFQAVCERHYGSNLDWFFKQWVYGNQDPRFKSDLTLDLTTGTLHVDAQGAPPAFRMPYDIVIVTKEGTEHRRFWLSAGLNEFSFESASLITRVDQPGRDWLLNIGSDVPG